MPREIRDTPRSLRAELDRQLFNLKTLYDVSHELLGLSDVKEILKNFLLMSMGNFGVMQGSAKGSRIVTNREGRGLRWFFRCEGSEDGVNQTGYAFEMLI